MFTQGHEVFQDNMIVEFKYVIDAQQHKQWIPLKVRYDKTLDLRTSGKNFGNAYHVANSNWHSIHRPITKEILITGKLPPIEEDVYYNKYKKSKTTSSMRFFHNKIKSMLIDYAGTIKADSIMLDLAVGKGGDISKWYYNDNIKFVLGIDVSKDNIENKIDGACKRYVEEQKNNPLIILHCSYMATLQRMLKMARHFYPHNRRQFATVYLVWEPKILKRLEKWRIIIMQ